MSSIPVLGPGKAWTVEDLDQLPDDIDWRGIEIVDGALVVSPAPSDEHGFVIGELRSLLDPLVRPRYRALEMIGVAFGASYRVPDLVVVPEELRRRPGRATPADVVLAVEVVSPSSVTTDRITKPAQYAAVGIGAYWRVETEPMSLTAYELAGDLYRELGTWSAGETAHVTHPFAVDIEVDRLA